jgi:formate dehydrogenase major subunit
MAECHPVGFQWVLEAKARGATVIHVDPRFTRTSALADVHVPLRAGTDIAFLGGVISHILEHELDFREYVLAYTNASTILEEGYEDTEDLDGIFSGFDTDARLYDTATWQYEGMAPSATVDGDGDGDERAQAASHEHGSHGATLEGGVPPARPDAAAPSLRVPGPEAPLRPVHPRDGGANVRHAEGAVPRGVPGLGRCLRP